MVEVIVLVPMIGVGISSLQKVVLVGDIVSEPDFSPTLEIVTLAVVLQPVTPSVYVSIIVVSEESKEVLEN